jgi:hypothetical protein
MIVPVNRFTGVTFALLSILTSLDQDLKSRSGRSKFTGQITISNEPKTEVSMWQMIQLSPGGQDHLHENAVLGRTWWRKHRFRKQQLLLCGADARVHSELAWAWGGHRAGENLEQQLPTSPQNIFPFVLCIRIFCAMYSILQHYGYRHCSYIIMIFKTQRYTWEKTISISRVQRSVHKPEMYRIRFAVKRDPNKSRIC